jgi:hypothetical protein
VSWFTPVIPVTQEAEIRRIMVRGQHRQKISKPSHQQMKLEPEYTPAIPAAQEASRWITVQANPGKKHKTLPEK